MTQDSKGLNRRTFLGVAGAAGGAAVLGGAAGCSDETSNTPAPPVDAGAVTDYTAPVWKLLFAQNLIVGRDAGGFFAYSAQCTHAACTLNFGAGNPCIPPSRDATSATGELCCQCHGSRYTPDGAVIPGSGPASRSLPHYEVAITSGRVMVNRSRTVGTAARTPAA